MAYSHAYSFAVQEIILILNMTMLLFFFTKRFPFSACNLNKLISVCMYLRGSILSRFRI